MIRVKRLVTHLTDTLGHRLANISVEHFHMFNSVPNVIYFGPEKCLKEFRITCGVASKRQVFVHFIE